jgi:glucoamylase
LLTGERAHYELARGQRAEAQRLLEVFQSCCGDGLLLPEQVWDADDIPERELFRGKATGSAMPLVWAHAEHVKLMRSLREGRVFDMPPQTRQRYIVENTQGRHVLWCPNNKLRAIERGKILRIVLMSPATVHWSADGWRTIHDTPTDDVGLGVHFADIAAADLAAAAAVDFTLRWLDGNRWEGFDYRVTVDKVASVAAAASVKQPA